MLKESCPNILKLVKFTKQLYLKETKNHRNILLCNKNSYIKPKK